MKRNKSDALLILQKKLNQLDESSLYAYRIKNGYIPVFGEGNPDANIMMIGEAPGKEEALSGKPFCGRSGAILNQLFEENDIKRSDVYITSIVKDRPEDNRDPTSQEIVLYGPILLKQIEIIEPRLIVTLGRFAMEYIGKHFAPSTSLVSIGESHGRIYKGKTAYGGILILPLYHPAATMYNRSLLPKLQSDFQQIKKLV